MRRKRQLVLAHGCYYLGFFGRVAKFYAALSKVVGGELVRTLIFPYLLLDRRRRWPAIFDETHVGRATRCGTRAVRNSRRQCVQNYVINFGSK